MLDVSVVMQRLNQGQPSAEMTFLSPPAAVGNQAGGPAASAPLPSAPAEQHQGAEVDPHIVAELVYNLMRDELLVLKERLGRW
jgi:hypothetical protein